MLQLEIIESSISEWCSPIVLVSKKDGSLRFCIDRYLNAVSKWESYPMPRIDELLDRVGKSRFITTLDLSKGCWQLALAYDFTVHYRAGKANLVADCHSLCTRKLRYCTLGKGEEEM